MKIETLREQTFWVQHTQIESNKWHKLLGVTETDNFSYDNDFWTKKEELNAISANVNSMPGTISFKIEAFYQFPITHIMIITQDDRRTVLKLPTMKPLINYFI